MRALILLITSIITIQSSYAQNNELGVFVGGSNFIGDVGSTNYISPDQLAIGAIYKWNRSERHSFRTSIIYTDLKGSDSQSHESGRQQRDYNFSTKLTEISAGIELTFIDFDLHSGETVATPYAYTGISAGHYDNSYFNSNGVQTQEGTSNWAWGIPMALGFKSNFLGNMILAIEVGARYTFSDNLDGSLPESESLKEQYKFGNINNNDWYMFTGITLTYSFGRKPCYCIN